MNTNEAIKIANTSKTIEGKGKLKYFLANESKANIVGNANKKKNPFSIIPPRPEIKA